MLSEDQITAIIDNKRVLAPEKDILEVSNAIKVYDQIDQFNLYSSTTFLKAHKILMKGLIDLPDKLRKKSVGIFKGDQVAHVAPPPSN